EIRGGTKAIRFDGNVAVKNRQRRERRAEQFERPIHRLDLNLRESAVFVISLEDVAEDAAQRLRGCSAGKQRNLATASDARKAERPHIIEAENVVGVAVRVEHGVNLPDALADRLFAEIRRGV